MIIYIIIYHIINNKNFNIDIGIKHNTIVSITISTTISASCAAEEKKREREYAI